MELRKKNSLEDRAGNSDFVKMVEWSILVTRTHKRHLQVLGNTFELLGEQFKNKLAGIRK